jgi:hypothetical protein
MLLTIDGSACLIAGAVGVGAGARGPGLPRQRPALASALRRTQCAALMRSLEDYSAENGLQIEGAARALTSAARSAHPAQMSRLVSDQIRI